MLPSSTSAAGMKSSQMIRKCDLSGSSAERGGTDELTCFLTLLSVAQALKLSSCKNINSFSDNYRLKMSLK